MQTAPIEAVPVRIEPTLPAQIEDTTEIGSILRLAVERGTDVEQLEKLVDLYERVDSQRAAQAFAEAMADFRGRCPPVPRRTEGKIATKAGVHFTFMYANLDDIQATIDPVLAVVGLSYTWDSVTTEGRIKVFCTIRHVRGHSITVAWETGLKSPGAEMSEAQNDSKGWTTARRQSLVQGLGIKTGDPDMDSGPEPHITPDQATHIEDLLRETKSDRARFLRAVGAESVETMPAGAYRLAVTMLEGKRK